MSRTLLLDLEISPTLATVWGLWNQNIGINQITGNSEILCWAGKWYGSDEVIFSSKPMAGKRRMIREMHNLLSQADTVVTYNGDRFDLKILNQEFMMANLPPPSPYHSVDLLRTMRNRFRGTSNKLDYWAQRLGLGSKVKHGGHQLWLDCMANKKEAWDEMEEYNIQDVILLESLLDRVIAWVPNMPVRTGVDAEAKCKCGSTHFQKRGIWTSKAGLAYQRYQCNSCGDWFRSRQSDRTVSKSPIVRITQI